MRCPLGRGGRSNDQAAVGMPEFKLDVIHDQHGQVGTDKLLWMMDSLGSISNLLYGQAFHRLPIIYS